jgi:general secretion pathway protein A
MYETFFQLQKNPFSMTPDPDCLYMTASHCEALSGLLCAVMKHAGFVVLTGDPGTGKTTLLASLIRSAKSSCFSMVVNPTLDSSEFLEMVLLDFGFKEVPQSKAQRIVRFQELLMDLRSQGKVPVLIVDEAHKLSPEVLEEIRLLTNFETAERKLLQIVLAGQRELACLLNREDLRQLKQRIEIRLQVSPLALSEVGSYMRHRWTCAGACRPLPFSDEAIALIARTSSGIPRLINSICDNALLLADAAGESWIEAHHIRQVLYDLDLIDSVPAEVEEESVPEDWMYQAQASAEPGPQDSLTEETAPEEPALVLEEFAPRVSSPSFIMRLAERLNLGTVQLVRTSQQMDG